MRLQASCRHFLRHASRRVSASVPSDGDRSLEIVQCFAALLQAAMPLVSAQWRSSALDAGLNVIDIAECYGDSEEMIGKAVGHRRDEFYLFTKCGHPHGMESGANWSRPSILESIERSLQRLRTDRVDLVHLHSCRSQCGKRVRRSKRSRSRVKKITPATSTTAATAMPRSTRSSVARSIRSRPQLTSPTRKRPIANAAWKSGHKPANSYHQTYWDRLRKLNYPFLQGSDLEKSVGIALRFTLSVSGVSTAIVGTTKPERWEENARLLEAGSLGENEFEAIRERWDEVAPRTWIGQT